MLFCQVSRGGHAAGQHPSGLLRGEPQSDRGVSPFSRLVCSATRQTDPPRRNCSAVHISRSIWMSRKCAGKRKFCSVSPWPITCWNGCTRRSMWRMGVAGCCWPNGWSNWPTGWMNLWRWPRWSPVIGNWLCGMLIRKWLNGPRVLRAGNRVRRRHLWRRWQCIRAGTTRNHVSIHRKAVKKLQ